MSTFKDSENGDVASLGVLFVLVITITLIATVAAFSFGLMGNVDSRKNLYFINVDTKVSDTIDASTGNIVADGFNDLMITAIATGNGKATAGDSEQLKSMIKPTIYYNDHIMPVTKIISSNKDASGHYTVTGGDIITIYVAGTSADGFKAGNDVRVVLTDTSTGYCMLDVKVRST